MISWGYHENADFGEQHEWQGTADPAAYLAVPKAIEVHATFDLDEAVALADEAEKRLASLGAKKLRGIRAPLMQALVLRPGDPHDLWRRLFEEHRVEVPVDEWEGRRVLRVSIGPYNDEGDVDRLVAAVKEQWCDRNRIGGSGYGASCRIGSLACEGRLVPSDPRMEAKECEKFHSIGRFAPDDLVTTLHVVKRLAITVLVVGVMLAVGLFAMSAQNEGCLPWQERVGVTDGPFGEQQDITACR